jgi:hypothetical protein
VIVTPLALDSAKNVLIYLLPLAVELWVFMIALVIFFYGIGILAAVDLLNFIFVF